MQAFLGLREAVYSTNQQQSLVVSFQKQPGKQESPGGFGGRGKSCHALLCLWQCGSNQCGLHAQNILCLGHPQAQASTACSPFQSLAPQVLPIQHHSTAKHNKNLHSEMVSHQDFCAEKRPKSFLTCILKKNEVYMIVSSNFHACHSCCKSF